MRGCDIASYINESMMNYAVSAPPKFKYVEEFYPNFGDKDESKSGVHVDTVLRVYLSHFYKNFAKTVLSDFGTNEKYKSVETYLEGEMPVFRE